MESPSLKGKLKTLRTHVRRTEALADFLKKNPELATDCAIKAAMWRGRSAYISRTGHTSRRLEAIPSNYACSGTTRRCNCTRPASNTLPDKHVAAAVFGENRQCAAALTAPEESF